MYWVSCNWMCYPCYPLLSASICYDAKSQGEHTHPLSILFFTRLHSTPLPVHLTIEDGEVVTLIHLPSPSPSPLYRTCVYSILYAIASSDSSFCCLCPHPSE